jgi:hypothetical protein
MADKVAWNRTQQTKKNVIVHSMWKCAFGSEGYRWLGTVALNNPQGVLTLCRVCMFSCEYPEGPGWGRGWPEDGGPGLGPIMLWEDPPGEGPGLGPSIAPGEGPGPGEGPCRGVPPMGGSGVDILNEWDGWRGKTLLLLDDSRDHCRARQRINVH